MTQIKLKSSINNVQMAHLLHLFNTWHIEAEIATDNMEQPKLFSNLRGTWKDRDVDAKKLRQEAWV